jgi:hypothetical protein
VAALFNSSSPVDGNADDAATANADDAEKTKKRG